VVTLARGDLVTLEGWLSRRAVLRHMVLVAWFSDCFVALLRQVHHASERNSLSDLYSIEWPAFALAGVQGWWQLLETDLASSAPDRWSWSRLQRWRPSRSRRRRPCVAEKTKAPSPRP